MFSRQELDPVLIGCHNPPSQLLLLRNTGTCAVDFSLDLSRIDQVNKENYDFPIFSFRGNHQGSGFLRDLQSNPIFHPVGSLKCSESVPVALTFQPIEEKEYELKTPLTINGEPAQTLVIRGQGSIPGRPNRDDGRPESNAPQSQNSGGFSVHMPALAKLSSQTVHFGDIDTKVRILVRRKSQTVNI